MGTMDSRRWRVLWAFAAGSLLYLLQILPILSAALAPPEAYVPAWAIRNLDLPQYLTWAEAGRHAWFFPNYHAPWRTEPASGSGYVVTSRLGLLPSHDPIASAGRYQIYAFPGNTLGGYPGPVALGLRPGSTLRQGVRHWLEGWVKPPSR